MGEKTKVPQEKALSIMLLGPPKVSLEGMEVRFGRKKALALLCCLAAKRGKRSRDELAELLWPQSDGRRARKDLRSTLSRLRKTLGEDGARGDGSSKGAHLLVIDGDLLGVDPRGVELDLQTLEVAVSLARSETSPGGSEVDDAVGHLDLIARLEGALGAYRGMLMEGFSLEDAPGFELWLEAERARWRALFGELCERLSRLEEGEGLIAEAIGTARLWAKHAPLEEDAHRRLMELLSNAGESERALLIYEGYKNTLKIELQSEPSSQLHELAHRLYEEVKERASLGASLITSAATLSATALSALEVPLVGRQEEFGALVCEYHAAREGETCVVALLGEAGIGRTRLAEEFLLWAKAQGADVLKGGASEGTIGLAYGPLLEALRPRIERERAPVDLLEDVWLSELSRLLPELKERYPDLPSLTSSGEAETAKGALFEAIARMVQALASHAPVVLFLDDLQWADAVTLEVLDYAGRRWAQQGAPVLVLIAARSEESEGSSALERWLSSFGRRLRVRSLTLGPLGNEDVEGLLRRLTRAGSSKQPPLERAPEEPGASDGEQGELKRLGELLALETEGQPFYLVETLKALFEVGLLLIRSRESGEQPIVEVGPAFRANNKSAFLRSLLPKSVREVIHSRLSRVSAEASEVLRAGAVLERGFGFETVVKVAELREAEGLKALDELIERRFLLEEASAREKEEESLLYPGATYSFSHEKMRQVVYTEMGHARRQVVHRRAFEVLKERGGPATQLARHALAGGLVEPAYNYSVAAGDQAMEVFAARDAIVHYESARDLLAEVRTDGGQLPKPSLEGLERLYTQLGRTYEMHDEWENARTTYETMLGFAREVGKTRLEVVALNNLAVFLLHQETDPKRVRTLLEEAQKVAEEAGLTEALAETECNLSDLMAFWEGEFDYSVLLAEKALISARASDRLDLVARALNTLARVKMFAGRLEESAAHAVEGATLSRELAERSGPVQTGFPSATSVTTGVAASWRAGNKATEIECLTFLAYARIFQGRLQEGIAIARGARSISQELPERLETMSLRALGSGVREAGEYEEALELARKGTELARKVQDSVLLAVNLDRLGEVQQALLNLEEARAAYEEALGRGYGAFFYARLSVVAALSGNWEDANAHARRACEVGMFFNPFLSIHLHHEVEALLRGGEERSAREEVHRFTERAEANERERIACLRSLAVLSEFEGDTKRAIDRLREAQTLAQKIGLPGELWQIKSRIGDLYEQRGEDRQAREAFSGAAQTLRMLAQKIGDDKLREGFVSAPQVRRVLGHH